MDETEQQIRLTGSLGESEEVLEKQLEAKKLIREMSDRELDELWGLSELISLMVTDEKGRRMCER
jgi:hypothetical protein